MNLENKIMLITYANSMGRNLKDLKKVLDTYYKGIIGGVHILPFFPSSADRGFAPIRYDVVEEEFGTWEDVAQIGKSYYLMFDFMINHISSSSHYYMDYLKNKDKSEYRDMFIRFDEVWPGGEYSQADIDKIYKRKPRAPYIDAIFSDGSTEKIWCTFSEEQIDIDVNTHVTKKFMAETILNMVKNNASIIRLDAFAYAIKKAGTNCFFVEPEIWEMIREIRDLLNPHGVTLLPEIHEHYSIQCKIAEQGYWVYDFGLPMLLLYSLFMGSGERLKHWLRICPRKQFTTLDTHDGIGVVDVKDLLTDDEIKLTQDLLFQKGANVKRKYNTAEYNNLDVYQMNCTYYSALGNNDDAYLLARAVQFFAPGIPQVYYVGLLAGENDIELLEATKQGRDINRHCYTLEEIEKNMERSVLRKMYSLMRFRNDYKAFDGECLISETEDNILEIHRITGEYEAVLCADLSTYEFKVLYKAENGDMVQLELE